MTGKSIKPHLPMSEIHYLPPAGKKPRTPTGFQRTDKIKTNTIFYTRFDRPIQQMASRMHLRGTNKKNLKKPSEQYITLNGIPQTIRTDNDTAFTGKEFREF